MCRSPEGTKHFGLSLPFKNPCNQISAFPFFSLKKKVEGLVAMFAR